MNDTLQLARSRKKTDFANTFKLWITRIVALFIATLHLLLRIIKDH
jgi:hypothetical protein